MEHLDVLAGVLMPDDRLRALDAFKKHWHAEHEPPAPDVRYGP